MQNKIVTRQWKPNERIYVDTLSKEFHISQTPIRESLYKLEGMHLIRIEPRRGVYVSDFSEKDVLETLDIRIVLESFATKKVLCIDEELLRRMKDSLTLFSETIKARDIIANNNADSMFHSYIVGLAKNSQLSRIYENLHSHLGVQRLLYANEGKAVDELHKAEEEHAEILQAFEKKDNKEIRKTVRRHLQNVKRRISKNL